MPPKKKTKTQAEFDQEEREELSREFVIVTTMLSLMEVKEKAATTENIDMLASLQLPPKKAAQTSESAWNITQRMDALSALCVKDAEVVCATVKSLSQAVYSPSDLPDDNAQKLIKPLPLRSTRKNQGNLARILVCKNAHEKGTSANEFTF
ncbi:hypothetical protein BJ508DRAFT_419792 [Ascobolus immersus RN42]|uniref:Uncharacterized protein n=1 Tax=Ascobolus immersus RN42 TaxID=1160509 RepID=A0A3N4HBF2_ASCIM|nr:hypothetical protein BJ508DRAFT_419792 [Ascobolus immersus RN42]